MRWCCWRCWWRLPSPRWENCWWWWWRWFPPSGKEVPSAESLHQRAKVLLTKFHLVMAVLRPESLLLIFSRSKWLMYQKMGTGSRPGPPLPTRARQEPSGHLGGSLWYLFIPVFLIYSKIIFLEISAHLEMCIIGISDIDFSGPEF